MIPKHCVDPPTSMLRTSAGLFLLALAIVLSWIATPLPTEAQLIGFPCFSSSDCPNACECSPQNLCVGYDPMCDSPSCGDGLCQSGESCSSCSADCGPCPVTPPPPPPIQDACNSNADCTRGCWCESGYCRFEGGLFCSELPDVCGDGYCTGNETLASCPSDCYTCGDSICTAPWETSANCTIDCPACIPSCSGKSCGPDGCGGSCGQCSSFQTCSQQGQCVCQPSCQGRECGSDGCGGSCGTCLPSETCQDFQCEPQSPSFANVPVSCSYTLKDGYLQPQAGYSIRLEVWGEEVLIYGSTQATTDSSGQATLSTTVQIPLDILGEPVDHQVACFAAPRPGDLAMEPGLMRLSNPIDLSDPSFYNLQWTGRLAPKPHAIQPTFQGLKSGSASAKLYLSGEYDQPILIAEPFNAGERSISGPRSPARLWQEYNGNPLHLQTNSQSAPANPLTIATDEAWKSGILYRLWALGYDVWLVQPSATGEDVHEQAAEFAQALHYAAGNLHQLGQPDEGSVVAFGFSLGGLVVRTATARWSTPGESSWRSTLGLPSSLPVSLVITGDSPLRGALVNLDLQKLQWDEEQQTANNLNSCAAQQMLMASCSLIPVASSWLTLCDNARHNRFYNQGGSFTIHDTKGSTLTCSGGPAVLSLGDQGWPIGVRRVGWSNGSLNQTQSCFGDWRDRNPEGIDTCPAASGFTALSLGQEFMKVNVTGLPDVNLHYSSQGLGNDLEAGSRHDASISQSGTALGFIPWAIQQSYHLGTFIPTHSALDAGCPGCTPNFASNDYSVNWYNATHRTIRKDQADWVLGKIAEAWSSPPASAVTPPPTWSGPARSLLLNNAEYAQSPAGEYDSRLASGNQRTWAFWADPNWAFSAVSEIWTSDPNRVWSVRLNNGGKRVRVFLFNPDTGDPAFAETSDIIPWGPGWYLFVVQFDGTATGNAERLKVFVNGQQQKLEFWGDPVGNRFSGATGAPLDVGEANLELGLFAIFDGLTTAAERADWQANGIDVYRSDLLSAWRWDDNTLDETGANDLTGYYLDPTDYVTTTAYPVR